MRRRVRALVGAGLLAVGVMAVLPAGAAVTSVEAGWWTSSPFGPDPDVPPDGLAVQAALDPADPLAYAAVAFSIEPADRPVTLVLRQTPGAFSTADVTLGICPLTEPFQPAAGGSIDDAPAYDCTVSSTSAAAEGAYLFDVGAFPVDTSLAVAVLPTAAGDRVVLDPPSPGDLTLAVVPPPPPPTAATAPPPTVATPSPTAPPPPPPAGGAVTIPPVTTPSDTTPTEVEDAAPSPTLDTPTATLPTPGLAAAAVEEGSVGSRLLFALVCAAMIGCWRYAGRPQEPLPDPA